MTSFMHQCVLQTYRLTQSALHPSHVKNFIPFVVYVVMTPIFSTNQSQCARFSKNMVTLFLSFKLDTTARNLLIDSHHYKRHRKNIPTAFHPHNHSVKSIILKNFKSRDQYYLFGTSTHFIQTTKTQAIFWSEVHSKLQDQPGTFKCARARCKTCPFIHSANKISGSKRSIKINDHFTCTSAKVIYCITWTYCKKI